MIALKKSLMKEFIFSFYLMILNYINIINFIVVIRRLSIFTEDLPQKILV